MSDLADRIQNRLSALGITAHRASIDAFGRGDVIRDILNRRVENPRADTLRRLALVLQTSEAWLIGSEPPPQAATSPARDVPVFRANRIADPDVAVPAGLRLEEDATEYVNRPAGLAGARGIYAFFIADDGMAPRFETGELVYVSADRPPRIGDYVLARFRLSSDGLEQATVARLTARDAAGVTLARFNPPWRETLSDAVIVALHKILTFNDLAGF